MKSIIIVKWYDAYELLREEVTLNGMYEHDDTVPTLLHTETETRHRGKRRLIDHSSR